MKAGIFDGEKKISVQDVADPVIKSQDEAIVNVAYSCVCGSDMWFYRGISDRNKGSRIGHEFMGYVESVGNNVKDVKAGDFVIAPFSTCDGTCPECKLGASFNCRNKNAWGSDGYDGGQGQKVRVPTADGTLFVVPKDKLSDDIMPKLLPLTDVLCTGHHAAVSAEVTEGSTVAVIGDGAVGLCGVAAAKRLGAKRVILLSTHEDRAKIGEQFGATDIVAARDEEAIKQVKALTDDIGVDCVLESVGMKGSWDTAFGIVRDGGHIGFVGVPADPEVSDVALMDIFSRNIGIKGGGAHARSYIPELLPDVLDGSLDVSAIFSETFALDDLADAYKAMDERKTIKAMIYPVQ